MGFPHLHMRSKTQNPQHVKLLVMGTLLAFLLLFIVRSNLSSPQQNQSPVPESQSKVISEIQRSPPISCPPPTTPTCSKIPSNLVQTIVHYSTSNITPQQTFKEISVTSQILEEKSPCNFLVFGLGHDSLMWSALNHGGRTVFLEEDKAWIDQVTSRFPTLVSYQVSYDSKVREADDLMMMGQSEECRAVDDVRLSKCQLALRDVPSEIYDLEWDLIMVDAPTGYFEGAPGRMGAIYTAGMMARNRREGETHVFVHDVDRVVEDRFSREFLCEGYMKRQEGRLRHFIIPSHRATLGKPFCP